MTRPAFALFSDEQGIVHIGPEDTSWDTYTVCSLWSGTAHRTKSLFRVMGVDRVATCLQCIANVDRDGQG